MSGTAARGTLWLLGELRPPMNHIVDAFARAHEPARPLLWLASRFGRTVVVAPARGSRAYPLTVSWISPRLLATLLRAPEDVVVVQELNLTALFAVLSRLRRGRRVVALAEGDLTVLGPTGGARVKIAFRRAVARFVDAFVANGDGARRYLTAVLRVPDRRIVTGWWLAGLPGGDQGPAPGSGPRSSAPDRAPVFATIGQLIPPKGIDLLIDAFARHRLRGGPCELWIVGEGEQRDALEAQARRLGVGDAVRFLGRVPHGELAPLLRDCDVFVFPTLVDLIGRVVVEALSVGTPVIVSSRSGAAGTLVQDGRNGLVVDPEDAEALAAALARATDPATLDRLRAGARAGRAALTPEAAAALVGRGVQRARTR